MLRLTGRTNDRDVLVNTRPDVFLHIFANIWWIRFPLRYDMDMIGFNMPLSLKLEIEQGTLVNFKLQLYKSNTLTLIITIYSISPINIYDFCLVFFSSTINNIQVLIHLLIHHRNMQTHWIRLFTSILALDFDSISLWDTSK